MKHKPKLNEKGLGLLEVLAAIALLALGVTSIFGAFGNAVAWNQDAYRSTQAVSYAAGVMESFRARPDLIRVMPASAVEEFNLGMEPPSGFEATVSIDEYDQTLGLYLLMVRVNWSARGENHEEVLSCLWPGR